MALNNYAGLKAAVAAFLDVTPADISAVADDLIAIAEKRIFREVRVKEMEASLSATISVSTVALPTDYIDLKFAYYLDTSSQGRPLEKSDSEFIFREYPEGTTSGEPIYIATKLTEFVFGPSPNTVTPRYILKGVYYKRLTPVSTSANPLFAANPDLYLYATLLETEPVLGRDPRFQLWETKYRQIKAAVMGENQAGNGYTKGHYL